GARLAPWRLALKFLFQPLLSLRRTCSHCGHPFAGCVLKSADCTRSDLKDQNKCIACRNAVRSRTWGTSLPDRRVPEAECRTASSGKRCASRAFAGGAGRRCRLSARAFLPAFDACFHRYGPGSRVRGISDLTSLFPTFVIFSLVHCIS